MAGRRMEALTLTEAEQSELTVLAGRPKTAQALAQRARIILACAEGLETRVSARPLACKNVLVSEGEDPPICKETLELERLQREFLKGPHERPLVSVRYDIWAVAESLRHLAGRRFEVPEEREHSRDYHGVGPS